MDQNLTVSVVIPAYNASKTVLNSIESVLKQSFPVLEIIVVDDGSTDDTLSVLESFKNQENIEQLKIVTQSNGGPAKARNKGVKLSEGTWVAFLDSDDAWLPTKNERQIELIRKLHDCSILGTLFNYNGKTSEINENYKKVSFIKMLFKNQFYTSTVMVKKDVFSVFTFDENRDQIGTEDFKLWLQILFHFHGYVLNDGLVIYADNQSLFNRDALSGNLYKMEKGQLKVFRFLYDLKMINEFLFIVVVVYSYIKYIRRIVIAKF